jgi:hypothetical protein
VVPKPKVHGHDGVGGGGAAGGDGGIGHVPHVAGHWACIVAAVLESVQ